ncbi:hypothetical protein PAECIP111802_07208 [Paenibacillus allorhizosphaerae]|uniref:Uncharacterized protein n=2 Tax=Paenibacillus allorhizosphaerae TaxID=2849866 RepID=A0ABM8VUG0_9BACL|nr:hypothetical protein PAECIP111802_07208 [Paenibacillus allorhizosphaerae]
MSPVTFTKSFSIFQITIGVIFLFQALTLVFENQFDLSLGEYYAFYSVSISSLVWLIAGVVLLSKRTWGWITALSIYVGCLLYQGWSLWRVMNIAPSLERLIQGKLFSISVFLIIVILLLTMRKKWLSR